MTTSFFEDQLTETSPDALLEWTNSNPRLETDRELLAVRQDVSPVPTLLLLALDLGQYPPKGMKTGSSSGLQASFWTALANSENETIAARSLRNLWQAKAGRAPNESARQAIELFRTISADKNRPMLLRAVSVSAALELASSLNSDDLVGTVAEDCGELLKLAETMAKDEDPSEFDVYLAKQTLGPAGARDLDDSMAEESPIIDRRQGHDAWLLVLRDLANLTRGKFSASVDVAALGKSCWRFARSVTGSNILSTAIEPVLLMVLGSDVAQKREVHEWWIAIEADRANDLEPGGRSMLLNQLHRRAVDAGLSDVAGDLLQRIQKAGAPEMRVVRTEMALPPEVSQELERWIEETVAVESVDEALTRFTFRSIPLKVDDNAGDQSRGLSNMLPVALIGPNGEARRRIAGHGADDSELARLRRIASAHTNLVNQQSLLLAVPTLDKVFAKFDDSVGQGVQSMLISSGLFDSQRAAACAEAITLWRYGQFDAAAHAVTPRIEFGIREVAKRHGVNILSQTDGSSRGGHVSLNAVLSGLKTHIDEDLRLHLDILLVNDLGANLRNEIAHGDVPRVSIERCASLIHALFLVAKLLGDDATEYQ